MPVAPEEITSLIEEAFEDAEIDLVDTMGDQDHYQATITTAAFAGKNRLDQHRMVHAALEPLGDRLHALSLNTKTPT